MEIIKRKANDYFIKTHEQNDVDTKNITRYSLTKTFTHTLSTVTKQDLTGGKEHTTTGGHPTFPSLSFRPPHNSYLPFSYTVLISRITYLHPSVLNTSPITPFVNPVTSYVTLYAIL